MADWSRSWPAPAKINLFLHVTARRPDGYHELQTAFQFLDIGDDLEFRVRADGRVRLETTFTGVPTEENLIVRAAHRLREIAGIGAGADIRLTKRLPVGGGLGGGSSDAATTLAALNRLWDAGLDGDQLEATGLTLGADVPVFLHGRAAWAEGVGERLTPIDPPETWILLAVPDVSVSTAEVFRSAELTRNCPRITIRAFLEGAGGNVCEQVVRHRHPQVDEALVRLSAYGPARMTGTGACVFVPMGSQEQAEAAKAELPSSWTAIVTRGINRSPLMARLAEAGRAGP